MPRTTQHTGGDGARACVVHAPPTYILVPRVLYGGGERAERGAGEKGARDSARSRCDTILISAGTKSLEDPRDGT